MADELRIALIGQAAFGGKALNALVERRENVVAIFCPRDREGRPLDAIKVAARRHDIPVLQFGRMRDQDCIDAFRRLEVDLGVMAFVTDIVPDAILEAPTHGTIQYHPSLLPKHRGPSSINWSIIQGDRKTGLTIFWPDRGLDTGPILLQKEVAVEPDDTLGSLYFDKLFPMGIEAMVESVALVKKGDPPRIRQDEPEATYEGWCTAEDVILDWSRPVGDLYNMVRGADPSPGAGTTFRGESVQFFAARLKEGDTGRSPGEVVDVTAESFAVAASGGSVVVGRVRPKGSAKISAADWISSVGLQAGDRFGE